MHRELNIQIDGWIMLVSALAKHGDKRDKPTL